MSDCLFCKIAAGDIPADVVLDRENLVAFRDINAQAPTHILLIPKAHARDVTTLDASSGPLLADLIGAANELARSEGIDESGYRLVFNVGPDAGQTVFHLHLHLLGGRSMAWPPG
jgi:histidine triad (HIT) family protein